MSERSEAKRDGAKQQKNSGRGDYQKGDAQWRNFVVDYKEYEKSISISQSIWAKICTDTFKVSVSASGACTLILSGGTFDGFTWSGNCNVSIVLTYLP